MMNELQAMTTDKIIAPKKIAVNILTGFLGSGKTTLLKQLLTENRGRKKIAVLMNEIGEVSIDAKLLSGYSVDMFELNDGCICCTVNENFVEVIGDIAEKYAPDLIVIETTGVANPMSIIYSLLNPNLILDAVITTIDAQNFLRLKDETDIAEEQLHAADVVLITKSDLADALVLDATLDYVKTYNPKCRVFAQGEAALDLIFGVHYPNYRLLEYAPEHHNQHDHLQADGIETFRFAAPLVFDIGALQNALDELPENLWRLKGVIQLAEQHGNFILNYAYGRHTIEDYDGEADGCELIFIGKHVLKSRDALIATLQKATVVQA
jgi:cobalamin biosynthesis protein CobW